MQSVQEYMDAAIEAQNLTSDRQLARAIGITPAPINLLRKGKTLPSDETMIGIAKLAGEDVQIALLRLNIWRAGSAGSAKYYKNILSILQRGAASMAGIALCLAFTSWLSIGEARAATRIPGEVGSYWGIFDPVTVNQRVTGSSPVQGAIFLQIDMGSVALRFVGRVWANRAVPKAPL
ncbi:MAG: helix-turn-helix domain-containing protein [Pseudomonadota bacterium]